MKSIVLILSLVFCGTAFAQTNADKAADMFDKRDYTDDGIANTRKAIEFYGEAIDEAGDVDSRLALVNDRANAYYFLGSALTEKKERQLAYKNGMDDAQVTLDTILNGKDSHKLTDTEIDTLKNDLSAVELDNLTVAMYQKGINLGQWGQLEGIATSIGRIGEVLGNMERIEKFGKEAMSSYGPYRTIGRVHFTLPVIFGGDMEESENKLKAAVKNTLAKDASGKTLKYSENGYNNVYLAETLWKRNKKDAARKVIKRFADADPATLSADSVPENAQALERAQELVAEWK